MNVDARSDGLGKRLRPLRHGALSTGERPRPRSEQPNKVRERKPATPIGPAAASLQCLGDVGESPSSLAVLANLGPGEDLNLVILAHDDPSSLRFLSSPATIPPTVPRPENTRCERVHHSYRGRKGSIVTESAKKACSDRAHLVP